MKQDHLARLRQLNKDKQIVQIDHSREQLQSDIRDQSSSNEYIIQKSKYKKLDSEQKNDQNQEEGLKQKGSEHDHDEHQHQGCKHHHHGAKSKKGEKGRKHRTNQKNYCIIFYCVFTCLSCFYLEVYCFNTLEEDVNWRKIKSFFTTFIVFMAQWSYFQTIRTQNTFIQLKDLPKVDEDPKTDQNYLSKKCQHCKYPKPARVSHCSTCGNCIMKLDHHCIWTQNCIGYRNQRPFILFTLYMSIGLFQFWKGTVNVFPILYGSCKFFSYFEPGVYIIWIITCFSALVVGMMIVALLISHVMMIMTNHTTLMTMKLKKVCPLPFCQFRDSILENQYVNHFDRGQIQNIRSLFGTNVFLAFLPLTRQPMHDFNFEPADPIPTKGQLLEHAGGGEAEVMRQQQLKKTILKVKDLFKGQKFIFKGQQITVK